ncbi:MAG: adenosine deaminase [Nitrococcus sp.]|nr:adenosine deaminase [Nitrococcus sp.]
MTRTESHDRKQALDEFIKAMPKVELHLHIEGTLEPESAFRFAQRNGVSLDFENVEALRRAYDFENLQSFLDLYNATMSVLCTEEDFFDLTWDYLARVAEQNVVHTEIFFDPQGHTRRGIPFATVVAGISRALEAGRQHFGISSRLILCFWRHLSEEDAFATWAQAQPHLDHITAVGLDSSEVGHPPEKFQRVYAAARAAGLKAVAHAGEEGGPDYIRGTLDTLQVDRIDHGIRCFEDSALVHRLIDEQTPLTLCPLSNLRLGVSKNLVSYNLARMLALGLNVCINSDDPAYFGGYITENLLAVRVAQDLVAAQVLTLGRNAIDASFLGAEDKAALHRRLEAVAVEHGFGPSG